MSGQTIDDTGKSKFFATWASVFFALFVLIFIPWVFDWITLVGYKLTWGLGLPIIGGVVFTVLLIRHKQQASPKPSS